MNPRIIDIAHYMQSFLHNLDCAEDARKVKSAHDELIKASEELKKLPWDQLFAIEDEKRQELTVCQQKFAECYLKLKGILLTQFKECFESVKKL